jgi:hypothetical protein
VRPRAVAATPETEQKTFEVANLATAPVAANLPMPPRRTTQPLPDGSSIAATAPVSGPSGLPGIMTRPAEPEVQVAQAFAPANLPLPPSRVAALAAQPRAARPVTPIRVKNAADAEGRADLTALIEAESARQTRPRAVVNVTPPPVETEIRREIVALKLQKSAPPTEKNGFAGGFIRPISPRFTKAGE